MRFYTKQHKAYCGIDLHARSMYVCILSQDGEIRLHRHMNNQSGDVSQGHGTLAGGSGRRGRMYLDLVLGSPTSAPRNRCPLSSASLNA